METTTVLATGLKVTLQDTVVSEVLIIPELLTNDKLFTLVYRLNFAARNKASYLNKNIVDWLVESCKVAEFTQVDFKLNIEEKEEWLEVKVVYPEILPLFSREEDMKGRSFNLSKVPKINSDKDLNSKGLIKKLNDKLNSQKLSN